MLTGISNIPVFKISGKSEQTKNHFFKFYELRNYRKQDLKKRSL